MHSEIVKVVRGRVEVLPSLFFGLVDLNHNRIRLSVRIFADPGHLPRHLGPRCPSSDAKPQIGNLLGGRLMIERTADISDGIRLLTRYFNAKRCFVAVDRDRFRLERLRVGLARPAEPFLVGIEEHLPVSRERYADAEPDAASLLSTGDAPRDASLPAAEHAAWTQMAITVLASDVAILLY